VKGINNSRGSTLAVAISMVFLFAALGAGAFEYATRQGQVANIEIANTQAFWSADAGLQVICSFGSAPPTKLTGSFNVTGLVNNQIVSGNPITSLGTVKVGTTIIAAREVQAICTIASPFQNGLFANGNIGLDNTTIDSYNSTNGNYGVNNSGNKATITTKSGVASITLNNSVIVDGAPVTNANITSNSNVTFNSNVNAASVIIPTSVSSLTNRGSISLNNSGSQSLASGIYTGISLTSSSNCANPPSTCSNLTISGNVVIYLKGSSSSFSLDNYSTLTISKKATLQIYTDGTINFSGTLVNNNTPPQPSNFLIYSTYINPISDPNLITVDINSANSTNSTFYGAIDAPGTGVNISNINFLGAVVGNTITMTDSQLHFDVALETLFNSNFPANNTLSNWHECTQLTNTTFSC
jgi:hypothetical protein